MIRTRMPVSASLLTRSALGIALAFGVAGAGMITATPAHAQKKPAAPKISLSKGFQPLAVALQKATDAAKGRADVTAARTNVETAMQQQNAGAVASARSALGGLLSSEKAALEAAQAAISTPDDRFMFGSLAVGLGTLAYDNAIQRRGLAAMIESGKADPAQLPRYNFFAGSLAYQDKDFPGAIAGLQAAVDAGFVENNAEAILAESYIADGKVPQGLAVLKRAIDRLSAAGTPAPLGWYRRGLGASFNAQMPGEAGEFAERMVRAYPQPANWGGAITVVREINKFASQETLDLMRLMGRTNSYAEERDFVEYIQAADPRRLPGEVMKVIEAGTASGKLRAADTFVSDARTQASGRVAEDTAGLAAFERDARKPGATEATLTGAADALLSYGQAAKAEELYTIALTKPGVDTARVLTRLGIAQTDQGKYAEAQATFAKVTGPRTAIARLWSAYAATRAAPPAPAAPAQ